MNVFGKIIKWIMIKIERADAQLCLNPRKQQEGKAQLYIGIKIRNSKHVKKIGKFWIVTGSYYTETLDGEKLDVFEYKKKDYKVIMNKNIYYCPCSLRKKFNHRFCQHIFAVGIEICKRGKLSTLDLQNPFNFIKKLNWFLDVKEEGLHPVNFPQAEKNKIKL
jgi:hypothetical protein